MTQLISIKDTRNKLVEIIEETFGPDFPFLVLTQFLLSTFYQLKYHEVQCLQFPKFHLL